MSPLISAAALLPLAIGVLVLWANPQRFTNWVFAAFSLVSATWLYCIFMAVQSGMQMREGIGDGPVRWIRAMSAVGAFFPTVLWLMKESILRSSFKSTSLLKGALMWAAISIGLVAMCYLPSFAQEILPVQGRSRGTAYVVYMLVSLVLFGVLFVQTYKQWRKQDGIRRLELQVLILNAGIGCIIAVIALAIGNYFDLRILSRLTPLVIVIFYAGAAWAVTIHRIFDARQVLLSFSQRAGMIIFLCGSIFWGTRLLGTVIPENLALFTSVAFLSTCAFWLEWRSRDWFGLSAWKNTTATRQAALEIARREPDPNKLIVEFESLLRSWCQTNYAVLLFDSGEVYSATDIEFAKNRPAFSSLCKQGWSTPESLQRLRPEPGLTDLRQLLTEYSLGLVVTAPRGTTTPSLLLCLGVKVNYRPFTYPEVQQVQEIAEFMDNILARSRLSRQARQSEQLATIGLLGASLAHEIRNPLVSIKTFSHLLPTRFGDPEFRRRFSVLIPAEVERIDNLTQQLLDLSNPRKHQMDRVSLHTIAQETVDLMAARAQNAQVILESHFDATSDTIWADASAIRQVVINLLINAFQAMENQDTERRVDMRSRNTSSGSVILEVSDNGPGIPAEQKNRLFHPFVSTKTKGMGLGLAVCADILHEHKATIIVPDIGRPGATFRITFPCPPPSS